MPGEISKAATAWVKDSATFLDQRRDPKPEAVATWERHKKTIHRRMVKIEKSAPKCLTNLTNIEIDGGCGAQNEMPYWRLLAQKMKS